MAQCQGFYIRSLGYPEKLNDYGYPEVRARPKTLPKVFRISRGQIKVYLRSLG
jgi:hypothetical protein